MPSNTVTEHRNRNPCGRDKRKNHKRSSVSPFRGKVGNSSRLKGCAYCNPKLANRIERCTKAKNECKISTYFSILACIFSCFSLF